MHKNIKVNKIFNLKISKIITWLVNASFWGIGILTTHYFLTFIDNTRNWIRFSCILILGGLVMHLYNTILTKDAHYIEYYGDIFDN